MKEWILRRLGYASHCPLKSITLLLLLPGMLDVLPQVASYSQKLSLAQLKYAFDKFTAAGIRLSE
jgi:hypothetical protein